MTKTIVNLLISVVASEVEEILDTYDDHPYQQAFAIPEMRQELIAFVLSHLPSSYTVIDESLDSHPYTSITQVSESERHAIRHQIHEGIQHILNQYGGTISHHIPETDQPGLAPTHWFG
jgi:hypothetical protein